ncbi:cytochrome C nitrite reductase [Gallibacterium salpingitidis]|uniref:Cytochrome C nitrite reductase n=1 Tax=Gallibacterium salpingitidis TaxID=505341 RepID=A0AB36E6H2_9PAST|nr:AAA family ATPase [Gallibacterium salpingitidis]OBX08479.1 cytochrome C nitrite reductase [Gallibacterium salpingitidis]OBX11666.1 cytochrome C nitrite reductase [Gallibacterium salpingitidis]
MQQLFENPIRFEDVKGVGTIELPLEQNKQAYTFIGENGIGKTKLLECLFSLFLLTNKQITKSPYISLYSISPPFRKLQNGLISISLPSNTAANSALEQFLHNRPIVYLSAQQRGSINQDNYHRNNIQQLGNKEERQKNYFQYLLQSFSDNSQGLKNLNMDTNIEQWIIQRAQSANPYQTQEDNREIEIRTLLHLLNQIDTRIDANFLEISGDNRVFLKIENQKRELSELSSGFASILKILQSIIAGYSYFTNEVQIAHVPGIVLIDEIESHLHNQWQVKIIPLLKTLFPNTIFFITTHSSLVISQLEQGEAYHLSRNKQDGIVYASIINNPSKVSLIDLMQTAFDVDLNKLKISHAKKSQQINAKQTLLAIVEQELNEMEAK